MASNTFAEEKKFQWSVRLSASEQYDNNIFLEKDYKKSDWLTVVGPGFTLKVLTEKTPINLDYDLGYTYYARDKADDELRHRLSLSGFRGVPITDRLTVDLNESLYISDDPIEEEQGVTSVRRDRRRYYRNTADGRINYLFGAEDSLYLGFYHGLLQNNDSTIQDSQRYGPRAGISYWFNIRNGITLDSSYERNDFEKTSEDNFEEYIGNATFIHRFNPNTNVSLGYKIDSLDYKEEFQATQLTNEDYIVHSGSLGLNHQFTRNASVSLSGGYWLQDRDVSDNRDGFIGELSFTQMLENLSFTLSGSGGYRQQFNEAENLGFSKFYRASAALDWQLLENLTAKVSGFYQRDNYKEIPIKREDDYYGGYASLTYLLLPGLSASLSYDCRRRDSNISSEEFTDNRVTFSLVGFYLSEPKSF
jgi:hypothetical protein